MGQSIHLPHALTGTVMRDEVKAGVTTSTYSGFTAVTGASQYGIWKGMLWDAICCLLAIVGTRRHWLRNPSCLL